MKKDGLNSIEYKLVKQVNKQLYTHLFVSYDEIKILSKNFNMTLLNEIRRNETELNSSRILAVSSYSFFKIYFFYFFVNKLY